MNGQKTSSASIYQSLGHKVRTARWALGLAWRIDKRMMLFWFAISTLLNILPAVALLLNRQILSLVSAFTETGVGTLDAVIPYIILYGIVLTAAGLSNRLNVNFLYSKMYDSYYLGMEETMMEFIQRIPLETLFDREVKDEFNAIIRRAGSLTDLLCSGCILLPNAIGVASLLIVSARVSLLISGLSLGYLLLMIWLSGKVAARLRNIEVEQLKSERKLDVIRMLPMQPGTAKEIRVYGNGSDIEKQWEKYYAEVEKSQRAYTNGLTLSGSLAGVSILLLMAGMLTLFMTGMKAGQHELSDFLMLYTMCESLTGYVGVLSEALITFDRGLFALQRQKRFMDETPTFSPRPRLESRESNPPLFEMRNVSFRYNDHTQALKNINLTIRQGEVVALVGPNGSGKSTLVSLLMGLYSPSEGQCFFKGQRYDANDCDFVRQEVGVFLQDCFLLHCTLRENIGMGFVDQMDDKNAVWQAVRKGGAEKLVRKLPKGLDTLLLRDVFPEGAELSGGEKQRVGASRAYMGDQPVVIFDEPAAALDPIAEMEQFEQIRDNVHGSTAILISHRVGFARLADRVIVLSNGEIAETGTHDELMAKDGLYAAIFHSQAMWYDKLSGGERV